MSHETIVGMMLPDGKIISIFCPKNSKDVLKKLKKHYTTTAKIKKLIALGDISFLGENIKTCISSHKALNRPKKESEAIVSNSDVELIAFSNKCYLKYTYVWDGKKWSRLI